MHCPGLQKVLEERGLFQLVKNRGVGVCAACRGAHDKDPERSARTDCCCRRVLECQPDFLEQACRLAEAIRKSGHLILFLPKFHPELNRTTNHSLPVNLCKLTGTHTCFDGQSAVSSNRARLVSN